MTVLIMKDFLGKDLKIGDAVSLVIPRYRDIAVGVITRATAKKLVINYFDESNKRTWKAHKYPKQLIKVDGPELSMYLLKINMTK